MHSLFQFDTLTLNQDFPFPDALLHSKHSVLMKVSSNLFLSRLQNALYKALLECQDFFSQQRINKRMGGLLQNFRLQQLQQFDALVRITRNYFRSEQCYIQYASQALLAEFDQFAVRRLIASVTRLSKAQLFYSDFATEQKLRSLEIRLLSLQDWENFNQIFKSLFSVSLEGQLGQQVQNLMHFGRRNCVQFLDPAKSHSLYFYDFALKLGQLIIRLNQQDIARLQRLNSLKFQQVVQDRLRICNQFAKERRVEQQVSQTQNLTLKNIKQNTIILNEFSRKRPRLRVKTQSKQEKETPLPSSAPRFQVNSQNLLKALQNQSKVGVRQLNLSSTQQKQFQILHSRFGQAITLHRIESPQKISQYIREKSVTSHSARARNETSFSGVQKNSNKVVQIKQQVQAEEQEDDSLNFKQSVFGFFEELKGISRPQSELKVEQMKWQIRKGKWSIPYLLIRNLLNEKQVFKIIRS